MQNKPGRGFNVERVRKVNLSRILDQVHRTRGASRSELALATGLARSAVKALVEELIARGLVSESPGAGGSAGRPSSVVVPRGDSVNVLAIEIAVDAVSAAIGGPGGMHAPGVRIPRPAATLAPGPTMEIVRDRVRPLVSRLEAAGACLVAVGVSFYGVVSTEDGVVRFAPNLRWHDVPLADLVRDALAVDVPVLVANDADLGALAEHRQAPAVNNLIFVSGEVGVGGGIICDGRPLRGATGLGGELGHMCVNPNGLVCGCGAQGCWETEIGEAALLRYAVRSARRNRQRAVLAVLDDAELGDPEAQRGVQTVGRWLGLGLANVVNIFGPEQVILGGFFARAYPLVREIVEEELNRRVLPPLRSVTVRPTSIEAASLHGAVELALGGLLADPTTVPRKKEVA